MEVKLLTSTPDAENLVVAAAWICTQSRSFYSLLDATNEQKRSILKKVLNAGHFSVLEHAVFTFGISGISRACSHQLVRHRVASFSQQSQRQSAPPGKSITVVVPPSIMENQKALGIYEQAMRDIETVYDELLKSGVPVEDARFVLSNATTTTLVATMNARELWHFFRLRCCKRAQWEIRELAEKMLHLAQGKAPMLFAGAGAACVSGACPEGDLSCGYYLRAKGENNATVAA